MNGYSQLNILKLNNDFSKNHYPVVISVNQVEIFAQKCKKSMIPIKYFEIMEIFGKLETYRFSH